MLYAVSIDYYYFFFSTYIFLYLLLLFLSCVLTCVIYKAHYLRNYLVANIHCAVDIKFLLWTLLSESAFIFSSHITSFWLYNTLLTYFTVTVCMLLSPLLGFLGNPVVDLQRFASSLTYIFHMQIYSEYTYTVTILICFLHVYITGGWSGLGPTVMAPV